MTNSFIVTHNKPENRFEVELETGKYAVLIYMIKAGLFIFLHTEVPHAYEGRGIARNMAEVALHYSRLNGYKVRSYCSYITRFIEKNPEYQDLLG